jgi:hypothetical protein
LTAAKSEVAEVGPPSGGDHPKTAAQSSERLVNGAYESIDTETLARHATRACVEEAKGFPLCP